jgi:regulator of protease activity HflC (stomatin/prohibitin superfamily)
MQRSIVPLLAFGGLCLMVSSAVVVVEPQEEAIVERLGRPLQAGEALGPGLHWKLPWPIDRVYRYPVRRVQQIVLGAATEEEDKRPEPEMVLWTTAGHGESKDNFVLVAIPPERSRAASRFEEEDEETREGRGVPVTILRALAPVQYRIKNVFEWAYGYANPEELLEGLATRELVRLAANLDADRILGAQRAEAAAELRQRIQSRCDEIGLGVEITFVGFQDFHPDKDVASAYQNVVGAEQERESLIEEARAQMNTALGGVAGDVRLALELAEAVRYVAELGRAEVVDDAALREATARRDALFARAAGDVSARMSRARGERWRRENEWLGNAERFSSEVAANRSAPRVYQYWRYLESLRAGLANVRKVLVAVDMTNRELVVIFDQKQEETFRGLK